MRVSGSLEKRPNSIFFYRPLAPLNVWWIGGMPKENRARGVLIYWNLREGSEGTSYAACGS